MSGIWIQWPISFQNVRSLDITFMASINGLIKPEGIKMKSWIKLVMAIGLVVGIGMPAVGSINVPDMDYYYSWAPDDTPHNIGGTWNLDPYDPISNPLGYIDYPSPDGPKGAPYLYEVGEYPTGSTYLHVPNIINPQLMKHVYLEIVSIGKPGSGSVYLKDPWLNTIEVFDHPVSVDLGSNLWDTTWEWVFPQIYSYEEIYLDCLITSDAVVSLEVGNKCVPEPATILIWSLLSLTCGGLGLRVWRRNSLSLEMMGGTRTPWSDDARRAIHQLIERGRN
jgi:hypothetical protein